MKAVVYARYGAPEVLEIKEVERPTPKSDEVLIKVVATSVTAADWRLRKPDPFLARLFNGLFRPKRVNILGIEVSGIIEAVGSNAKAFAKGDAVFAFCEFKFGGYAEYKCMRETDFIALKPSDVSFEEAATTPLGALTALSFLRKGGLGKGKRVLIYGASGSVGTFAIQLAKYYGAEVTAVCSGPNISLVASLGADKTIDYTQEDFRKSSQQFDIIFDAVGRLKGSSHKKVLLPHGKFVSVRQKSKPEKDDMLLLKELLGSGKLVSVIDRVYSLDDIQAAHRYVEQLRKKGNVAIRVS